ncbi:prolyl oligopeptidase family serine peptidase [Microbispora sp. NEAU-D428]|uniref:alpha/beta hydrolase family protein n=1 Tax=Microbispora sitophila TaxID=2771537 RepID=UPI00186820D8|nr:prolyl oligopeptidase family serine peptidase [Microbispora sitophila]MBE3016153.1 prolyl oligopeptidase family serine peptidase [Microbispora sitophila]
MAATAGQAVRAGDSGRRTSGRRLNFRFSVQATRAACLVANQRDGFHIEAWSFEKGHAEVRLLPTASGESHHTQLVPVEDGRVVLVRHRRGAHEVAVASLAGERSLRTAGDSVLHAIPSRDPATLVWLVTSRGENRSLIHRVGADDMRVEPVLEVPGRLMGEGWLNEAGDLLAANQVLDGRRRIVTLDLRRATVTPLPERAGGVLLTSPRRGEMLVAAHKPDGVGLGWLSPSDGRIRFCRELHNLNGTVLPLTLDPEGGRLALRLARGAASRLLVHDIASDTLTEVPGPRGVVRDAGWSETGLRVLFSSPTTPAAVVGITEPFEGSSWRAQSRTPSRRHWHDARLERFQGPAGKIEAVVYGEDWRRSRHLLVALHGGPEAAWELTFDPIFQRFADAGITIVAPNQRGSTGYGAAHRDAIKGCWGGPDLADIRRLLATLLRERGHPGRRMPMLFGVGYGAFLALLAAAADPSRWSRCVAIAPFVSGDALHSDGPAGVRSLLDRLGGLTEIDDGLGARDLLRLAPRITAPVLLMHGERDEVIPVVHSRLLARQLGAAGRRASALFRYQEIPHAGHDLFVGPEGPALVEDAVTFLLAPPRLAHPQAAMTAAPGSR